MARYGFSQGGQCVLEVANRLLDLASFERQFGHLSQDGGCFVPSSGILGGLDKRLMSLIVATAEHGHVPEPTGDPIGTSFSREGCSSFCNPILLFRGFQCVLPSQLLRCLQRERQGGLRPAGRIEVKRNVGRCAHRASKFRAARRWTD